MADEAKGKVMVGKANRRAVARGIWYRDGTMSHPTTGEDVDAFHYQLLDDDGVVVGHGGPYIEENVEAALEGVAEGRFPVERGRAHKVADADADLGKLSETDHVPGAAPAVMGEAL